MRRLSLALLLLSALFAFVSASSAPTFCKCSCFKNSTIVPLDENKGDDGTQLPLRRSSGSPFASLNSVPVFGVRSSSQPNKRDNKLAARATSPSCSRCTKSFCLSQNLDICKDASDEDVQTMCFQRDSNKDMIIVWGFILGTTGLLGWAAARKVLAMRGMTGGVAGTGVGGGYSFLGRGNN